MTKDHGDAEYEENNSQYADGSIIEGDDEENGKKEEMMSTRHAHPPTNTSRKKSNERRNQQHQGVWGPTIGDGDEFELLEMDIGRGMP
eukprot:CAMPEP_0119562580 /NCGR_PEP_ID=MMETSP1352-20130426/20892_1 /TAXON_ID=265584 /ORGANISM="Stauroneis constricta, Strain CCMP1120" /LENGTH=87 /DNA_ID=CAMNT_0007611017 /DNA_START=450 /DNA_END=710 /DNA_ORIENTATION=+